METRLLVYSQVLAGELSSDSAAAQLGVEPADVRRGVEALEMARVMLEQDRLTRRRARRQGLGVVGVVVGVAMAAWAIDPVWAQVTCAQTLPSPLVTFCPDNPALASQVNGNFQGVAGWITNKAGPIASQDITTRDISARNVSLSGPMGWGTSSGQLLNLYQTGYGFGIQNSTLYSRTGGNFAWYVGGSHANSAFDPGGGSVLMTLTGGGDFNAPYNSWGTSSDTGESSFSSNTSLAWNTCANGRFVCGIGVGHIASNGNYWTGARIALRCCDL